MKFPQLFALSLCLLGATHFAQSQVATTASHPIPGTLDPATGKFTTRIAREANAQPEATTGTNILFRETFQISISNYDQPGTTAVCSVDLISEGDGSSVSYDETAAVTGVATSSGFNCTVPVLAQWLLTTPTTDNVYATITVTVYTPGASTTQYGVPTVYRSSTRNLTLTQPSNTQTVVTPVNISL